VKPKPAVPLNRQILDEASVWFVDFRVGDVDAPARERFDQWLRTSPEHIRAYIEIAKAYVEVPALKSDNRIDIDAFIASARAGTHVVPHDFGMLRAKGEDVGSNGLAYTPGGSEFVKRHFWPGPRAVAAGVVVAALASAVVAWLALHRYPTYLTGIGENRSIKLVDGSTIYLNARSRVVIEFFKSERHVDLIEGQALFFVAKDPARPFVVRSDGAMVRALGTQFDVNRNRSGTTVTVVEGRVAVLPELSPRADASRSGQTPDVITPPTSTTFISAGEQVTVTPQAITKPKRVDPAVATAWTQHRLVFEGTPLSEVVDDFNRYNTRPLVIDDGALVDFHVSGVYTSTDPVSLVRFLRDQPGFQIIETDGAVHVSRR
jgi:transmembrane sensor